MKELEKKEVVKEKKRKKRKKKKIGLDNNTIENAPNSEIWESENYSDLIFVSRYHLVLHRSLLLVPITVCIHAPVLTTLILQVNGLIIALVAFIEIV